MVRKRRFFRCSTAWGWSVSATAGLALAWISGRASGATTVRAAELKISHLLQAAPTKLAALQELLAELKLAPGQCVYMGDDDIDAAAIAHAGIGVTVPGAMPAAWPPPAT